MISFKIPLKTVSEANSSEHWTLKRNRHKEQQFLVREAYYKYVKIINFSAVITLTRLSPRLLDDDNLVSAFKWIRDELSECIFPSNDFCINKIGRAFFVKGRKDADPRLKWIYKQEKNPISSILIQIEPETPSTSDIPHE